MNELTPSHPAPPPPQSRGLAAPYSFSANALNANVVNVAAMDRAKSFQGGPRGSVPKYQSQQQQQQLQQVNDYHTGPYANYSHLKNPADSRTKFDYAPSQQYSPHPTQQQQQQQQQQQSYAAAYGYPAYAQNYGGTGNYQQQQQQQPTQQQQYHGGYAQVGETNPLGMLVSSATNPQAPQDAMPHEPVNIGLKDAGDRKFRQPYGVVATDSFLNSGGGYVHGIERSGNVVQIKATSNSSHQQQPMHQRSNMYGGGASYFPQQQQRTQEPSQQHNPMDLVPPGAAMGTSFDANGNGGASSAMGRGMHNGVGGMFPAGLRMPQFSPNSSASSLTTRLKDGSVDISTGVSSNGGHLPYMQQQPSKSLEVAHTATELLTIAAIGSMRNACTRGVRRRAQFAYRHQITSRTSRKRPLPLAITSEQTVPRFLGYHKARQGRENFL
ncbi:hypothetical protein KRP22_010306 [Phytophthora ramorum]|nr:hypothetical protein KRP22_5825 [Phytophthora ramorum]